ncbi:hypothetical protein RJ640_012233 [Escallonia rubra]|uniref:ATP-dependent DNA helicase n=1 Tax=Escallonia rubra TaxID=112253 RepID=A0AA88R5I5_9ASTE|nr:hypothetical protein RJ640_012233 [Escallonia rubra]
MEAYKIIMQHVRDQKLVAFFIDGPGGTCKTYMYKALLATVRSEGFLAVVTASSWIAASNLPDARMAHSRFKILLENKDILSCNKRVKYTLVQKRLLKPLLGNKPESMDQDDWEELQAKVVSTIQLNLAPKVKYQVLTQTSPTAL